MRYIVRKNTDLVANQYSVFAITILFFTFTFLEIVSLSSFPSFTGLLGNNSSILLINVLLILVAGMFTQKTLLQMFFWFLGISLITIYYFSSKQLESTFVYQIMIILAVPASGITFEKLVKIHLHAMASATLLVVVMSFLNFLPKSGAEETVLFSGYQNTVYAFGFIHPNFLGMLIILMGIEFTFLNKESFSSLVVIVNIMALTLAFMLGAHTSFFGGLIVFSGYLLSLRSSRLSFLKKVIAPVPIIMVGFAYWITTQGGSAIYQIVNKYVSSRPDLWSYYVSNFHIKYLGSNVVLNLNSGPTATFGNGILDGSYVYLSLYFGWFALILFIVSLYAILKVGKQVGYNIYMFIFLSFSLMAFSENESSLFTINVFLIIIGYYQYGLNRAAILFSNRKELYHEK